MSRRLVRVEPSAPPSHRWRLFFELNPTVRGLPDELVVLRDSARRTVAVKQTVIAGFLYAGRFYTRQQAADLLTGEA